MRRELIRAHLSFCKDDLLVYGRHLQIQVAVNQKLDALSRLYG
jgi:hypothetical protein